jgi:replicative DNA helicase
LRGSGAIEQDADAIWLLHRKNRKATDADLVVAKDRFGPADVRVKLFFDPQFTRFESQKSRPFSQRSESTPADMFNDLATHSR